MSKLLIENYLDFLNQPINEPEEDLAKEWRGVNHPYGDDSNRPNLVRECMTIECDKMKVECLKKLREQAAMNPFYQYRIDRFIDAVVEEIQVEAENENN